MSGAGRGRRFFISLTMLIPSLVDRGDREICSASSGAGAQKASSAARSNGMARLFS